MSAEILLDTSSPVITINQSSLLFKINQNYFQNQLKNSNSSYTLYPLSQTELLLTNITSSYIAYRSRITKKKYYSVEPSHLIIPPNSNIIIKITFYHNFRNTFPPEGHKFRFEGIVIPNNMKKMDAWKIYEQFSKDKTEVKGNSIRKVAEFIFDNNYNPNFEEENKKIDISQSMNSINLNDFNVENSYKFKGIKLNTEAKSELDCKDEKELVSCNVTKAHFGKKGEYHTYYNDSFGGDLFPQQ